MNIRSTSEAFRIKPSRAIGAVLSPAVRLLLRSQLDQVEDLQVKIEGSDRLLLSGHVPNIAVSARRAVYQGLHLGEIALIAQEIRINLNQVLKGQPLRLLAPVCATAELHLEQTDLNASLKVPLLANALTEVLHPLLFRADEGEQLSIDSQFTWQEIELGNGWLKLIGVWIDSTGNSTPVVIRTIVQVEQSHKLRLTPLEIESPSAFSLVNLDSFEIDLGSEVEIEELSLIPGQLVCRGRILIRP